LKQDARAERQETLLTLETSFPQFIILQSAFDIRYLLFEARNESREAGEKKDSRAKKRDFI
jgi:hypothetical protein